MQNTATVDYQSSIYEKSPAQLKYEAWAASLSTSPPSDPDPLLKRREKLPCELQVKRIDLDTTSPRSAGGGGEPLGLLPVRNLRQDNLDEHQSLASMCRSLGEYEFRKNLIAEKRDLNTDSEFRKMYVEHHAKDSATSAGFKVSRFRSGEMVGGFYTSGLSSKCNPPSRTGRLSTRRFTRSSLVKLRRSVECSDTLLSYFHTLTFAPSCLQPWHLNEDGTVNHYYAKWKLEKYCDALSQKQRRLGRVLAYCWVAELQKNGNIHFHILMDKFFPIAWLTKIWGQANNSVDIERAKNPLHAARYMRKYITKDDESEIQGNRYYISKKLRESMKPIDDALLVLRSSDPSRPMGVMADIREFIYSTKTEIEANGGVVLDFGFYIPMPRQSVRYRDKKTGEFRETKAVSPVVAKKLYSTLYRIADKPF